MDFHRINVSLWIVKDAEGASAVEILGSHLI